MDRNEMDRLIEEHLVAEAAGDVPGAVAMYTDDVIHDVVGMPTGPGVGKEAAMGFYNFLTSNLTGTVMAPTRTWYGEDFCVAVLKSWPDCVVVSTLLVAITSKW